MSKITIALGSLVLGATLGFAYGSHGFAPQPVLAGNNAQVGLVAASDAIPRVPPISSHVTGLNGEGGVQQLDGVEFKDSEFSGMTFTYGGGAFVLTNTKLSRPMSVRFVGAAANALAVLAIVDAVNKGARPAPLNPNAPVLRQTSNESRTSAPTIDFRSPF